MQGKIINGFELKYRLGVGGMAEVWYAENEIHMAVAVKILNRDLSLNDSIVERFRNEAEIMVKLHHPNIRQVHGYGSIDGRPAIIMEYLEGDDLKARMKKGQRFTDEELVKWWNQLVDALKYTHEEGIVHRDIKPGNIFVDKKGNVKLLDFGIAKVRESISSTQTGQKLGTLMYMSPEQVRDSKHIDYHTDIYSLAVTFVHLLTGKKPYDSDTCSDYDIQTSIVTKPLDLNGVPERWKGFLIPYLEKEPSKRPELRYFEAVVLEKKPIEQPNSYDEETIVEGSPKKPEHSENSKKKNKLGLWIGLAVAAVAIGVIVVLNLPDRDTELYDNCRSVADYRGYVSKYGEDGKHYNKAKSFIDSYVADSTNKAQKAQAEAEAKAKAKAEQEAKAKAEQEAKAKKEAEAKAKKEAEAKAKKEAGRKKNGEFAVSSNKNVQFSKGNLQYQASTNTWRFAEHQWDIIGDANKNISSSYSGWIDLFSWGTSGYNGKNPWMLSSKNTDYGDGTRDIAGTNYDWGVYNVISNGDNYNWRTLTKDEWFYIFNKRITNSGIRYAKATVNGVKGVILLPDNWNSSNYSLSNTNKTDVSYNSNRISQNDWQNKFEAKGAVFLPAAGYRVVTSVYGIGSYGDYWSSSYCEGSWAWRVSFRDDYLTPKEYYYRGNSYSVRLVRPSGN